MKPFDEAVGLDALLPVAGLLLGAGLSLAQTTLRLSMDSRESIKETGANAAGYAWFQPGVRAAAIGFDGIGTAVSVPAGKLPDLTNGFTVGGWVALEAYPWTTMTVIGQEEETAGFCLGIDAQGHAEFRLATSGRWHEWRSEVKLALYQWNHLAATWSPDKGLRLYVNGREVAAGTSVGRFDPAAGRDLMIGRNAKARMLAESVGEGRPAACSLEGLLDEVRLEAGVVSAAAVAERYQGECPHGPNPLNPPKLPAGPDGPGEFGAVYTRLNYTKAWEHAWRVGDDPDVLVRFDRAPFRFVFWRGTSFIPCWVTGNGIWYTNEFVETGENRQKASAEPMADKQTRTSHARIIENHAARVVVHWRYAPVYPDYSPAHVNRETGWSDWVDEYYTLYPDGVGVREIRVYSDYPLPVQGDQPELGGFREFHESIIIHQPGTRPEDNLQTEALTLANMNGQSATYSWADGPPRIDIKQNEGLHFPEYLRKEKPTYPWRAYLRDIPEPNIHVVNLKSRHSPFVIVPPDDVMVDCYVREVKRDRSAFPWWNHWPVSRIESNGRWAIAPDRPSHSSLTHIYWPPCQQDDQSLTKIMLHGMTDGPATSLVPLAKSWIQPATLRVIAGVAEAPHYNAAERAYQIAANPAESTLRMRLDGSTDHPVVNPAFVIAGWGERPVTVTLDRHELTPMKNFRSGFRKTVEGTDLVIWLDFESTKPCEVEVKANAKP